MTVQSSYIETLENENRYLKEQIEWFRRQIFGKKSEKSISNLSEKQLEFEGFDAFKKSDDDKSKKIKSHERRRPNRNGKDTITLPEDLPVERQEIDLPKEEKVCSETGKPLKKIGEEITLKLAYKPGSYFIKEIVRPKYAFPQETMGGINIAPLPEGIFERCRADESFLADILVKKYVDHLPLYRIQEGLSREGILISRQILCKWVHRCGEALKPLYDIMKYHIFSSRNIFVDETPVPLQIKGKGKLQKAYMWVLCGGTERDPPYRVYHFFQDRKHKNAENLLKNYKGVFHSDKYKAYETLAESHDMIWCPCWVHIRRKFFEAESGDPSFRKFILRKIRYLFMFEKVAWARSPEERIRIRQEKEIPIIDELIKKIKARLAKGKILPKSKFSEALGYFCGLIPHLKNYTRHPFARLDNNVAERAVRPLAIGRKNWLFIGNKDRGQSAAVIISLVQTCRAVGVNPRDYLEDIMRRLMSHNSQKLEELLPTNWKPL